MEVIEISRQEQIDEHIELFQQAKYSEAEAGFIADLAYARESNLSPNELGLALINISIVCFALSKLKESKAAIDEALMMTQTITESNELKILRALCLNTKARIHLEFDECLEAEGILLEAIELCKPIHSAYAAEITGNLVSFYAHTTQFQKKVKAAADEFERLHALNEPIEVYFDDLAGWRRPGRGWDRSGAASPESIEVRNIFNRMAYKYESKIDGKADCESILKIDEETKQVPPHLIVQAYISLAEMAFMNTDLEAASKISDQIVHVIATSYLRTHPASYRALLRAATFSLADPKKCEKLFDEAANLVRKELGELTRHYAICLSTRTLMQVFLRSDGADHSKERLLAFRKCLSIAQSLFPDTNSYVIDVQLLTADTCTKCSQYEEAESLLGSALVNLKKNFLANDLECRCRLSYADLRTKQGKMHEAKEHLQRYEELLNEQEHNSYEKKVQPMYQLGKQYMDARLPEDAERVYRKAVSITAPLGGQMAQKSRQQLALCLMQIGKSQEASTLLNNTDDSSLPKSKREELIEQSQQALGLNAGGQFAAAKVLATKVMNEAHQYMPECEEAFVIAVSILIDGAKKANQADEMLQLIGMFDPYKESIRVRSIMPTLYLEMAQVFAAQKSIRADGLFEQALQAAENGKAFNPQVLDACCFAYMNHLASKDKIKALELCEQLLIMRADTGGKNGKAYADALTSKALIMSETDPQGAEPISRQSLEILGKVEEIENLNLLLPLTVRVNVLKKLLRFDECKELEARLAVIHEEIKKRIEDMQAKLSGLKTEAKDAKP